MKTFTPPRVIIRTLAILSAALFVSLLASCTVTVWDSNGVGTTYLGDGSYVKQWPSG